MGQNRNDKTQKCNKVMPTASAGTTLQTLHYTTTAANIPSTSLKFRHIKRDLEEPQTDNATFVKLNEPQSRSWMDAARGGGSGKTAIIFIVVLHATTTA